MGWPQIFPTAKSYKFNPLPNSKQSSTDALYIPNSIYLKKNRKKVEKLFFLKEKIPNSNINWKQIVLYRSHFCVVFSYPIHNIRIRNSNYN